MPSVDPRLHVVRLLPVLDFGGVESRAVLQAQLHDDARIALRVCTFWRDGAAASKIRALGVPVDVLNVDPSIRNPAATLALARYLRQRRVDVLHASIGEANLHAALVGHLGGARAVIMEEAGIPSRRPLGRLVHALLYRLVDHVVGVSDASCSYLIEREFAPPSRVTRIYNTIPPAMFDPMPDKPHGLRCIAVGRLAAVKNQAMLLRVIHALRARGLDATLQLVGDGPLATSLRDEIARLGLERAVELCGFREDVRALLDQADLFLLPSHSEGFGLALVEAMARGCIPLATRCGGPAEILAPLGQRFLLEPRDEEAWIEAVTRELLATPARRQQTRLAMRARAEDFSPQRYLRSVESLYAQLCPP